MATVVLGVAAAAGASALGFTAGSLGAIALGATAALAGGFIDNKFLFPPGGGSEAQHFETQGPRVGGLQVQAASEGSPVPFLLGPENRLAVTIIWMSDLIEEKKTTTTYGPHVSGGLKGGGGSSSSTSTTYSYFVNVAIAIGEGEIEAVDKVWANGQIVYENPALFNVTGNVIRAEPFTDAGNNRYQDIISAAGGPDLSVFKSGLTLTMSGWNTAILNDEFTVSFSEFDTTTGETKVRLRHPASAQATEAAGANVTITQTPPNFGLQDVMDVRFYPGDLNQLPDPLIEATEGAGEVPGFRGVAYMVFERLALANYGNGLPQFSVLARKKTTHTLSKAISDILTNKSSLQVGDFDTSTLTDELRGFAAAGPQPAKRLLSPLMKSFNLLVTESNGQFKFTKRGLQVCRDVNEVDLAAHEEGQQVARPITITDTMGVDLPAEVNVKFVDPTTNYQPGSQRERRLDTPSNTVISFDLPVVMSPADARAIARRELWSAWQNRQVISLNLPPSYIDIEENDLIEFPVEDELYVVLVKKIDRGHNFVMSIEGVVEYVAVNDQIGEDDDSSPVDTSRGIFIGGDLVFEVIDIAPFSDDENLIPGVYMGTAKFDPNAEFLGSTILESGDGQLFEETGSFVDEFFVGLAPQPVGPGPVGYFDLGTTFEVCMRNGTLESVTEEEMLEGANRAVLGDEVIAFQNAVLTAPNTYQISKLLRGLRNTEDKVNSHTADDERFILLTGPGLQFFPVEIEQIGFERTFKSISPGQDPGKIPGFLLTPLEANSIQTFSPDHVRAYRNSNNDAIIHWIRRTRATVRHYHINTAPLLETRERYDIEILNVTKTAVVREIRVEATQEVTYTAQEQIADGLAPGAPINVRVYQLSEIKGKGKPVEATV